MTLWTRDGLTAARHIDRLAGDQVAARGEHHSFRHDPIEWVWEMDLKR